MRIDRSCRSSDRDTRPRIPNLVRDEGQERAVNRRPNVDRSRRDRSRNRRVASDRSSFVNENVNAAGLAAAAADKAIISPRFDAICGGGLSLAVAVFVMIYGWITEAGMSQMLIAIEVYLLTDLLINGPHFMASYRLLYSRPQNLRRHPMVSIVAPVLAVVFLGYILYWSFTGPTYDPLGIMAILTGVAPIFLAWHYTGQSWGTTACFAFLSGLRMSTTQRRLIRSGFLALFVYHVAWAYDSTGFVQSVFAEQDAGTYLMSSVMSFCRLLVAIGFLLGLWGFYQLARDAGKSVPMRVWLPWVATFSWYVMVDFHPASFFLLQAFHAFQYLMFPARVELNDYTGPVHRWRHLIVYYVLLVVVGYVAFDWSGFYGVSDKFVPAGAATMMVINLHHYFIDAVIWKIREPEVRQSLFGHLEPAAS